MQPIAGPLPGTDAWYSARLSGIFASEAAAACGVSPDKTPFQLWCVKRGLLEPFEGNEFTDRGKRFEPFLAAEYSIQTGNQVQVGLPTYFHPEYSFIGATPDGQVDKRHGVEFKCCHWRRAKEVLGAEGTDEIPPDWVVQVQQQMYVMDWDRCDVFVMVDLHSYKLYEVLRNEPLIKQIISKETDLWQRVLDDDPPPPELHLEADRSAVKALYLQPAGTTTLSQKDQELCELWAKNKAMISSLEKANDELQARLTLAMGDACIGNMTNGTVLIRSPVKATYWTQDDIAAAVSKQGTVKRKAYCTLRLSKKEMSDE